MFAVTACAPPSSLDVTYDDWTETNRFATKEYEIFRDHQGIMSVRGVAITRGNEVGWGVLTNIRRTVPNGPIVEKMVSGSVTLNYQRHDRKLTHCFD